MDTASEPSILCKICLVDHALKETYNLQQCHCVFCIECLQQYLSFEIMTGAYKISCPDSQCPKEGIFLLDEIVKIVGKELLWIRIVHGVQNQVAIQSAILVQVLPI